jgi:hypothetical protein
MERLILLFAPFVQSWTVYGAAFPTIKCAITKDSVELATGTVVWFPDGILSLGIGPGGRVDEETELLVRGNLLVGTEEATGMKMLLGPGVTDNDETEEKALSVNTAMTDKLLLDIEPGLSEMEENELLVDTEVEPDASEVLARGRIGIPLVNPANTPADIRIRANILRKGGLARPQINCRQIRWRSTLASQGNTKGLYTEQRVILGSLEMIAESGM